VNRSENQYQPCFHQKKILTSQVLTLPPTLSYYFVDGNPIAGNFRGMFAKASDLHFKVNKSRGAWRGWGKRAGVKCLAGGL
jgi:hypothetical protein